MTTKADGDSRRARWLGALAAGLFVPLALVWWPGCRQYSPVTSRESLGLMQLLYTACNTKDPVRLAKVESGLEKLAREGKMAPEERRGFDRILAMAKANDWAAAEAAAFKFAQDQVGVGHPDPEAREPDDRAAKKTVKSNAKR